MRDRLADSRFDNIRLLFRSSITGTARFGSSEPELELFWFGSSKPESEEIGFGFELSKPEFEMTGSCGFSEKIMGSCCWKSKRGSCESHGVKPPSKGGHGIPSNPSKVDKEGKVDSMAGKLLIDRGRREVMRVEDVSRPTL
ncbi:hypothetical protein F0562_006249 [Nyssa sinensis]|uniref:Uncharacterized protein n=1 Tax=Nyssa sinensis TaxID=561372 RepID=A0A5J5ALD7_9ASTE|nr:hypothetical protein F0562_006249 [Nyssa sinensis]